jgi:hypothetical protein
LDRESNSDYSLRTLGLAASRPSLEEGRRPPGPQDPRTSISSPNPRLEHRRAHRSLQDPGLTPHTPTAPHTLLGLTPFRHVRI